jgi:phosphoserine phosphatase
VKLLVLDVEGTIFESMRLPETAIASSVWQAVAVALGPSAVEEEVATHAVWERGGYRSYLEWMIATIEIHRRYGLSKEIFQRIVSGIRYNANVEETVKAISREKYVPVLVSGGVRELTARAQLDLMIQHAFSACEYLFDESGVLRGYNLLPCDFDGKLDFIKLMLREYGLGPTDWVFVGDGKNDVPVARQAPCSIAYRAASELQSVATHCIDDFAEVSMIL